jgi:hypothetical protein
MRAFADSPIPDRRPPASSCRPAGILVPLTGTNVPMSVLAPAQALEHNGSL